MIDSKPALSVPLAMIAVVLGAVAMGVSPVFVREAEVGPFASAFWRATTALPVLIIWAYFETRRAGVSLMSKLKFDRFVVLGGVFFAGDLIFWHLSIWKTSIANATLLACLAPVWVALLSGSVIGEKVSRDGLIGIGFCLLGAAFLIGASYAVEPENLIGDIYGLITSLFFGLYFLVVRVSRRSHSAGALTFMNATITAAVLFAVALYFQQGFIPQSLNGVAAILALGWISHAGGQGLLTLALGALSAAFSSLVIFIEALVAAIFGWLIYSEAMTPMQILGGLMILGGIWIARPKKS